MSMSIGRQLQVLEAATPNPVALRVKVRNVAFQSLLSGIEASALAAQVQNIRSRMDQFYKRCACDTHSSRTNCDSEN